MSLKTKPNKKLITLSTRLVEMTFFNTNQQKNLNIIVTIIHGFNLTETITITNL